MGTFIAKATRVEISLVAVKQKGHKSEN